MGDYHNSTLNFKLDQTKIDAIGYFSNLEHLDKMADEDYAQGQPENGNPFDLIFKLIYRTSAFCGAGWRNRPDRLLVVDGNYHHRNHYSGKVYTDDLVTIFHYLAPYLVYEDNKLVALWGEESDDWFAYWYFKDSKLWSARIPKRSSDNHAYKAFETIVNEDLVEFLYDPDGLLEYLGPAGAPVLLYDYNKE